MSTTVTINGTGYHGIDELCSGGVPQAGIYYGLPDYAVAPEVGEPQYDESKGNLPARDGTYTVRSGFARLPIYIDLCIVNALGSVGSIRKALLAGLKQNARYTITLPDTDSYQGCKFLTCGRPARINVGGMVMVILPLVFEQLSVTN